MIVLHGHITIIFSSIPHNFLWLLFFKCYIYASVYKVESVWNFQNMIKLETHSEHTQQCLYSLPLFLVTFDYLLLPDWFHLCLVVWVGCM